MSTVRVPIRRLQAANEAFTNHELQRPPSLPVANPTNSFWLDSTPSGMAKEGSTGVLTKDADICIIGSGITGVSVAYHISKILQEKRSAKPLTATILESRDFCSGATGRNGGHLCPAIFIDFKDLESRYGTQEAVKSIAIENHTANSILKYIADEGLADKVDLVGGGHITLFVTEKEYVEATADFEAAKEAGLPVDDVEWIERKSMHETYGIDFPGARITTKGHNLWPLKLVTQLYYSAKSNPAHLSLNLHTSTPVTSIEYLDDAGDGHGSRRLKVNTPRGSIMTSYILHATNAYASYLLPHMHGPEGIVPTRGQVIASRAACSSENLTKSAWYTNEGFEYWFPRPLKSDIEGAGEADFPLCILGGGRGAASPGFEWYEADDSTCNKLVGDALKGFLPGLFPGKYEEGKEPEMEWSGIMGFTKMRDPFVGPVIKSGTSFSGQYISAGYSGHGMPRAFSCAQVVASMILADMFGETWEAPEWLPERFLTYKRDSSES
ncbi:hypothetical protein D9758_009584 [Tetrapyrgos nigripes]|uniref:FAD dependent oxidoreductase domain-containing protein n=1 Tax=Tetrapyrgos nigripes TaxID=182062 RepID=A0A8H5GCT5_9AGAR|nr:hypothetical protein D9758_009584 [Tetrapyrgos nigripes]